MNAPRMLVFGAGGQVGSALAGLLSDEAILLTRAEVDVANGEAVQAALEHFAPSAILNASAYTHVDKAEEEEALAQAINGKAPGIMARYAAKANIPLVHFSTDYVFDGSGRAPWKESDAARPLSAYGRSKRAGEEAVEAAGGKYLIFRTSWVYDAKGKNFLATMLRLGAEREELRVVNDQHGAPTYAPQLAQGTLQALFAAHAAAAFPSGIYHVCHGGETTWHGFAQEIFRLAKEQGRPLKVSRLTPIASSEYPTPAKRPLNSRLSCDKIRTRLGVELPSWKEGLALCMEELHAMRPHAA